MRRGTKVGQAYVALTVDGDGINDDIADAMGRTDFKEYGERYGKDFRKGLRKHIRSLDSDLEKSLGRLDHAFANRDILRREVRDSVKIAYDSGWLDPLVREAGRRSGSGYGAGFQDAMGRAVRRGLERELLRIAQDPEMRGISNQITQALSGDGKNFADLILPGDVIDRVVAEAEKANAQMVQDTEKSYREIFDNAEREQVAYTRFLETEEQNRVRLAEKASQDRIRIAAWEAAERSARIKEMSEFWTTALDARDKRIADDTAFRKQGETAERFIRNMEASFKKRLFQITPSLDPKVREKLHSELRDDFASMDDLMAKLKLDLPDREKDRIKREIAQIQARIPTRLQTARDEIGGDGRDGRGRTAIGVIGGRPRPGDTFGRMFGMGSRNNALNFIGKRVRNLVNLTDVLGKGAKAMGQSFTEGFNNVAEGAGLGRKMMAGFASSGTTAMTGLTGSVSKLASSWPALIAAIATTVTFMSVLVSVVSALTALVVALAATIATALVGSLTVLVGVLGAAAGAAGMLAIAFTSLDNAQKKALGKSFGNIRDMLRGLGQLMLEDIVPAFDTWAKNLEDALNLLAPLARVMGKAFATGISAITAALSGSGMMRFFDALTERLPRITTLMSQATANLIGGLGGLFAALMPYVERFAVYLEDVTRRFDKWASSAEGQNSIADWMDRAFESINSLWNAARGFFGWLGDVLFSPISQDAGNSMFDSLTKTFEGWRETVKRMTEDGSLQEWFDNAREFGNALKDAIIGVKNVFNDLNDSGVLQAVGAGFEALGWVLTNILGPALEATVGFVKTTITVFEALGETLKWIVNPLGEAINAVDGWLDSLYDYEPKVHSAGQRLATAAKDGVDSKNTVLTDSGIILGDSLVYGFEDMIPKMNAAGANAAHEVGTGLLAGTPWAASVSHSLGAIVGNNFAGGVGGYLQALPQVFDNALRALPDFAANRLNQVLKVFAVVLRAIPRLPGFGGMIDRAQALVARAQATLSQPNTWQAGRAVKTPASPDLAERGRAGDYSSDDSSPDKKGKKDREKAADKAAKEYVNPYVRFARSLINEGPNLARQIKDAVRGINDQIRVALREASQATDAAAVRTTMQGVRAQMADAGQKMVADARQALNEAARELESAGSTFEANRALHAVRVAQRDLKAAQKERKALQALSRTLQAQERTAAWRVDRLLKGQKVEAASLADYALAREKAATRLAAANDKLTEALALRDGFQKQVADAIRAFGDLLSAEAQEIDGIEQALTGADLSNNLRDRLKAIQEFRADMDRLLTMGLGQAAYKQLMEAGVEQGGEYAKALLEGGVQEVRNVNNLLTSIDAAAEGMGNRASERLYQHGVDMARGLVSGLESLDRQLRTAAEALGKTIANAVARELGIRSPSTVAIGQAKDYGAGWLNELKKQEALVGTAATSFARRIAVSPEVAAHEARMRGQAGVAAGNSTTHEWNITTPTTDPKAVAEEMMNEMTGRL